MTKFENIGVQYQYDADTKQDADKSFLYSCKCCCEKGMHIACDRCAISHAHSLVVAYFEDKKVVA